MDRIVIAGASGFIGTYLARAFRAEGAIVSLIGRDGPDARWRDTAAITDVLDGSNLLINLAGKSVNCRYTTANRDEIRRSRVDTTNELARAIRDCEDPPELWINSSTATIYRHAEDRPMTESTGELGDGFSVGVARAWEESFFAGDLPRTRRVALRMAIVLGDGSALSALIRLARFGLGGPQLDGRWFSTRRRVESGTFHEKRASGGRQRFSWIHIADVAGIIRFLREHPEIVGVVNASAPGVTDNVSLMKTLRGVLGVRFGLPAFRWMLELGSSVIHTETELVLKSRWVAPERLRDAGYRFRHPTLEPALLEIVAARR
ncbi:MAG: NAD-dependent epimerase [Microbacteriaceae bacterium]|nr:NAD-dependent epimerase [Microbacteriaceae bacterium]